MKKAFLSLFITLAVGSFFLVSAKKPAKRIHFKPGRTEICLRGYLRNRTDTARYVLRVKDHQTIEVLTSCGNELGSLSIRTEVFDSAGKSGDDQDMQGNSGFKTTTAGDYVIIVAPSLKGGEKGRFVINVSVK
jgi:hypothetical protein